MNDEEEAVRFAQPTRRIPPIDRIALLGRSRQWVDFQYRFECKPSEESLQLLIDHVCWEELHRHARQFEQVEQGGLLLGRTSVKQVTSLADKKEIIWISQSVASPVAGDAVSWRLDADQWGELMTSALQRHPGLEIVGWDHTHPGMGIFLSEQDLFVAGHFFPAPYQLSLVIDPVRGLAGAFRMVAGKATPLAGFQLLESEGV
ncbi:MAG: Mov34/MPN/PAD-1 family protein [Pirellulaceae bacterium]